MVNAGVQQNQSDIITLIRLRVEVEKNSFLIGLFAFAQNCPFIKKNIPKFTDFISRYNRHSVTFRH